MILPYRGRFHIEYYPKTASTAFAINDLVELASTDVAGAGTLTKVTSSSTNFVGTIQKKVAATDSDYAANTLVPVLVPDIDSEWLCDCSTTGVVASDVGEWVDADDENSINVGAYTVGLFLVTKLISGTQVIAKKAAKSGVAVAQTV